MIKGVKIINLRSIKNGSNFLRDGIKNSELKDKKFGEIYTSTISYKEIRAWKLQKKFQITIKNYWIIFLKIQKKVLKQKHFQVFGKIKMSLTL